MTFGYLTPREHVARADPRTQVDAEAEMQWLTNLIEGSPDHTPSDAQRAEWRERQDQLLAMWRRLPDDHED